MHVWAFRTHSMLTAEQASRAMYGPRHSVNISQGSGEFPLPGISPLCMISPFAIGHCVCAHTLNTQKRTQTRAPKTGTRRKLRKHTQNSADDNEDGEGVETEVYTVFSALTLLCTVHTSDVRQSCVNLLYSAVHPITVFT